MAATPSKLADYEHTQPRRAGLMEQAVLAEAEAEAEASTLREDPRSRPNDNRPDQRSSGAGRGGSQESRSSSSSSSSSSSGGGGGGGGGHSAGTSWQPLRPPPSIALKNKVPAGTSSNSSPKEAVATQLSKTKMCAFFERGRCSAGSCSYAHSQDELRARPNLAKTKLCPAHLQGRCIAGASCTFAHTEEELRVTAGIYKTQLCRFDARGFCKKGDRCSHAHGQKELKANKAAATTTTTRTMRTVAETPATAPATATAVTPAKAGTRAAATAATATATATTMTTPTATEVGAACTSTTTSTSTATTAAAAASTSDRQNAAAFPEGPGNSPAVAAVAAAPPSRPSDPSDPSGPSDPSRPSRPSRFTLKVHDLLQQELHTPTSTRSCTQANQFPAGQMQTDSSVSSISSGPAAAAAASAAAAVAWQKHLAELSVAFVGTSSCLPTSPSPSHPGRDSSIAIAMEQSAASTHVPSPCVASPWPPSSADRWTPLDPLDVLKDNYCSPSQPSPATLLGSRKLATNLFAAPSASTPAMTNDGELLANAKEVKTTPAALCELLQMPTTRPSDLSFGAADSSVAALPTGLESSAFHSPPSDHYYLMQYQNLWNQGASVGQHYEGLWETPSMAMASPMSMPSMPSNRFRQIECVSEQDVEPLPFRTPPGLRVKLDFEKHADDAEVEAERERDEESDTAQAEGASKEKATGSGPTHGRTSTAATACQRDQPERRGQQQQQQQQKQQQQGQKPLMSKETKEVAKLEPSKTIRHRI